MQEMDQRRQRGGAAEVAAFMGRKLIDQRDRQKGLMAKTDSVAHTEECKHTPFKHEKEMALICPRKPIYITCTVFMTEKKMSELFPTRLNTTT